MQFTCHGSSPPSSAPTDNDGNNALLLFHVFLEAQFAMYLPHCQRLDDICGIQVANLFNLTSFVSAFSKNRATFRPLWTWNCKAPPRESTRTGLWCRTAQRADQTADGPA
jgi:hypothetical protein